MEVPAALELEWRRDRRWLARLPGLVRECAAQWELRLEEPIETPHSLVVPAGEVVLKLNAPSHREADREPDALAAWAGRGAVRLLARDDERRALLLERCRPGTRLAESDADHQAVVAALLPRLFLEPGGGHGFVSMAGEAARWAHEVPDAWERASRPFERSLLDSALDVFRSADPAAGTLVNQDLHSGNVLAARREPWLVIDPKPAVGEPEVSGVGLLRNAAWRGGAREARAWLDALEPLGLDRERLRGWGVAHALAWGRDADGRWSPRAVDAARAIRTA